MDPIVTGALIGAGSSILSGLIGSGSARDTNRANRELMKYQNEWNLEQWNRQNEYNTPSATIERLVDAGVNPRAYNNIGQFANAGTPPSSASMSYVSPLSAYQSSVRGALENALMYQEVRKKKAEVDNTESIIDYRVIQKELAKADKNLKERMSQKTLNESMFISQKETLTMFQTLVFCAENGINPDDFGYGPVNTFEENGILKQGNSVFSKQKLAKLLESYTERLGYKMTSEKFLATIRKFEALTKEERYHVLESYGLDTDSSDSLMSLLRYIIRLYERLP